jgi:tetratricopeptide (TPR) repeat protein
VITLGLIEAWFDREKGIYIQKVPRGKFFAKQAQRFAFEALSYEQCRDYIQRSVDTVRAVNKNAKILITTSPVPLSRTFTTDDVITANSHSKSVLRAVAGDIAAANAAMDYFPSYESVSGTKNWRIWGDDLLHVSDAFVGKVVSRLTDIYCPGIQQSRKKYLDFYMASKGDNLNEALELGEQLTENSSPEYLERLSQVLERKGEINAAVNELKKAVDIAPAEPRLRFQFSKLLAQSGRMPDALSEARYCVALDPTNLRYRRHLTTLYVGDRNYLQVLGQRVLAALYRRQSKTQNVTLKRLLQAVCRPGVTTQKS